MIRNRQRSSDVDPKPSRSRLTLSSRRKKKVSSTSSNRSTSSSRTNPIDRVHSKYSTTHKSSNRSRKYGHSGGVDKGKMENTSHAADSSSGVGAGTTGATSTTTSGPAGAGATWSTGGTSISTNTTRLATLTEMVRIRGQDLCVHSWNDLDKHARAVAVVYHGFLAHGKYPTVVYAAEKLASYGYMVVSVDFPGHGRSPGLRGYLPSANKVIDIGDSVAEFAVQKYAAVTKKEISDVKLFLVGSSMGGNIALSVARKMTRRLKVDASAVQSIASKSSPAMNKIPIGDCLEGVVLLAPMLQLSVATPAQYFLRALSTVVPTWELIPSSSSDTSKQYRDPRRRKQCENDEFAGASKHCIRVGSALTCVELVNKIQEEFGSIDFPFLVLIGDEDVIVDNTGSMELMKVSPSEDKTLIRYPALHGLMCEPPPLCDQVKKDMINWVNVRAK